MRISLVVLNNTDVIGRNFILVAFILVLLSCTSGLTIRNESGIGVKVYIFETDDYYNLVRLDKSTLRNLSEPPFLISNLGEVSVRINHAYYVIDAFSTNFMPWSVNSDEDTKVGNTPALGNLLWVFTSNGILRQLQ